MKQLHTLKKGLFPALLLSGTVFFPVAGTIAQIPPPTNPTNTTPYINRVICHGSSTTLSATANGTLSWYDAPTGGNWLGSGSEFVTPNLSSTTTYYVQDSTGLGVSPTRTAIEVRLANPASAVSISPTQLMLCGPGSAYLQLNPTEIGTRYYLYEDGQNNPVYGPVYGTGGLQGMYTNPVSATTNYTVMAEKGFNTALDLDGVDEYVYIPSGIPLNYQSFTIEFWAKRDGTGTDDFVVGQQSIQNYANSLHVGFRGYNDNFTFAFYESDLDVSHAATTDGQYHHYACVYDNAASGTNRFVYIDGVLVASDHANTAYTGVGPVMIGRNVFSSDSHFDGKLDEMRFWNTARNADEVNYDMQQNCLSGNEAGLICYFDFNEGPGAGILNDKTPNNRYGNLSNMEYATDWVNGPEQSRCVAAPCVSQLPETFTLQIAPSAVDTLNVQVCYGADYVCADQTILEYLTENTTHESFLEGMAASGCDSIVVEQISVLPQIENHLDLTLCSGESIMVNGVAYHADNPSGTEVLPAANGCDSIVYISLSFLPEVTGTYTSTICHGETLEINGHTYSVEHTYGVEIFESATQDGCDSIVTVSITVLPAQSSTLNTTICADEEVIVNGTVYDANNTYGTEIFEGAAQNGCDSVVHVNLNVLPALHTTLTADGITFTVAENEAMYQWITCDGAIVPGATSQSFTAEANGSYAVVVSRDNCTDTSECVQVTTVGLNTPEIASIHIYPNPASAFIKVSGLEQLSGISETVILDINGKLVAKPDLQKAEIAITDLEAGVYYLRIVHEHGVALQRFFRQ